MNAVTPGQMAPALTAEYVVAENEFGRIDGVLRRQAGRRSHAVLLETHPRSPSERNLGEWPCVDLPREGVDTFAYNNRFTNSAAGIEVVTVWEELALDVACAVAEMRRRGYETVVLYGYSAGGPLVSFYQNVAERGNAIFDGAASLSGFGGFRRDGADWALPPADAIILQNATSGTASSFLTRLDGSVVDEERGQRDPALDLFEPSNGYDPSSGEAHYAGAFLADYFRAQCERMNRLVRIAQDREARVHSGDGRFMDTELLLIPGVRAEPASVDLRLAAATTEVRLLEPGRQTVLVPSNRAVVKRYRQRNLSLLDGAAVHTSRTFLSYRAVLTDPAVHHPDAVEPASTGVDFRSSNTTTPGNLSGISVPLLITAATADTQVHLPHAELAYNSAASADKQIVCIDGAEHDMTPSTPAFGDTRAVHLRVLVEWLAARFRPAG